MSDNINKKTKGFFANNSLIISSLTYLVLGSIMVIFPSQTETFLRISLGLALLIYGLFNIINFFANQKNKNMYFELIIGVLSSAFGIFSFISFSPFDIVFKIIGIVIVIDSLMDIKHTMELKRYGVKRWWISLIVSTAIIVLGIITIFFTSLFGSAIIFLLGIVLIYEGISGLFMSFTLSHYKKKYRKATTANQRMINAQAVDID